MGSTTIDAFFSRVGPDPPTPLRAWADSSTAWEDDYRRLHGPAEISEIAIGPAVFLFDHGAERVVLAYAVSSRQPHPRNRARMRGFPDVNVGVRAALGSKAVLAVRGHFLGHASGDELDINLFPHRRDLSRGWAADGKRFRQMERYVALNPGAFFFHRPAYDDATWVPASLEYGVLMHNDQWWREVFANKLPGHHT
jgi:hypothetical protein